jgi:hypothetical protein
MGRTINDGGVFQPNQPRAATFALPFAAPYPYWQLSFFNQRTPAPAAPQPFAQFNWPLPQQPAPLNWSYSDSYNLNLIGKDFLPFRQRDWPVPTGAAYPFYQLSYTTSRTTSTVVIPAPFYQTSWPLPQSAFVPNFSFSGSYKLNLIGQDQLPFRQRDWPLAQGAPYPFYQLNWTPTRTTSPVIAPAPFAQTSWPLPPNVAAPQSTPASWIQNAQRAVAAPFTQTTWPLPPIGQAAPLPYRSQTFPLALIGQDRLPNRQADWPLPREAFKPNWSFGASYNRNLIGKDRLPFRQVDWPVPKQAFQHNRSFVFDPLPLPLLFPEPIIPPPPTRTTHSHRDIAAMPQRPKQPRWRRPSDYDYQRRNDPK